MSELFDLSDAPTFFLVATTVIGVVFVAMPFLLVRRVVQDRTRRRTWTPTTARLLATRTETRSSGDDGHRTVVVGRWEYRAPDGTTHTGEGDLDGVWVDADGERALEVLVDPADPGRSVARTAAPGAALLLVLAVFAAFGVIGVLVLTAALRALTG